MNSCVNEEHTAVATELILPKQPPLQDRHIPSYELLKLAL